MSQFQQTDTLYNEVFISYSRKNRDFAQDIVDSIRAAGREKVWIDWKDIQVTDDWWRAIRAGIDSADNFLFILTPDSVHSKICQDEVSYAVEAGKRIITIQYEEVDEIDRMAIHPAISQTNWLLFTEEDDFDEGVKSLIEAIETDLGHVRFHTRLQTRARDWENAGRNASYLLTSGQLAEAQKWLSRADFEDKKPYATKLQRRYIAASQKAEDYRKAEDAKKAKRLENYQRITIGLGIAVVVAIIAIAVAGMFSMQAVQDRSEANQQITLAAMQLISVETQSAQRIIDADIQIVQAQSRAFGPMTQAAVEVEQMNTQSAEQLAISSTQIAIAENNAKTQVAEINIWSPIVQAFNCDEGYCVEMALVPPGCFNMGTDIGRFYHERPVHLQCISEGFWIDVYEVSNEQFDALGGQAEFKGVWSEPLQPQASVTWREALAFCRLRGGTLPTEAQWEYAARGRDSLHYPWGDGFNPNYVRYIENAEAQPARIGSHPQGASWVGALDMLGNVAEWTSTISDDIFFQYPYIADDGREDLSDTEVARILRGGSFLNEADDLYAAARGADEADSHDSQIGFRCILPLD